MGVTRIFASEEFDDFARDARLTDEDLVKAVKQIESGLVSADLGGNVIKQRIARKGGGKSGGYRTVVVFRDGDRAVFVEGFAKNVKTKLTPQETKALKRLAKDILALSDTQLAQAVTSRALRRIERNEQEDDHTDPD